VEYIVKLAKEKSCKDREVRLLARLAALNGSVDPEGLQTSLSMPVILTPAGSSRNCMRSAWSRKASNSS
jgi:hypothetical protein